MEMEGSEIVLRDLVEYYCAAFLYDNARFFAERLFYTSPKSEHLYLLAKCYRGQGKSKQVYHILRDDPSPQNRYLFAHICIELGKYSEAQSSLLPSTLVHPDNLREVDIAAIPGGGAGLYLLGITCRKENRKEFAISYFKKALEVDKTCWAAYTELCEMGVNMEAGGVFGVNMDDAFHTVRAQEPPVCTSTGPGVSQGVSKSQRPTRGDPRNVLERRRIAERTNDTRNSPYTAASLGLSSLALRVGFATPGGLPSSLMSPDTHMAPLSSSMLGESVASSHMGRSGYNVPLSAMQPGGAGQRTTPAGTTPSGADVGNALFHSPAEAGNSDMLPSGPRTVPVREAPRSGPATADIGGRLFGTPDSESIDISRGGVRRMQNIGDFDTPGLTPITARRLSTDAADMSMYNLQMSAEGDHHADEMMNAFKTASAAGGPDGTRRRVSFGPSVVPNSRLSFSSAVGSIDDLGATHDGVDRLEGYSDDGMEDSPGTEDPPPRAKISRITQPTDQDNASSRLSAGASSRSRIPRVGAAQRAMPHIDSLQTTSKTAATPTREGRQAASERSGPVTRGRSGSSSLSPTRPTASSQAKSRVSRASLSPPRSTAASRASAALHAKQARKKDNSGKTPGNVSSRSPGHGHSHETDQKSTTSREAKENADSNVHTSESDSHSSAQRDLKAVVETGERVVLSILAVFGEAYRLLNLYQCHECIQHLQQLPRRHYSSGWVQHAMGRAHFELNDYKSCQLSFREMLRLEPFRVAGTEILSTALWQLKRDKELCALAQQVVEIDKTSPESWCVVGNCFSLQQEHEAAIKFFDRAIQVDPSFTYARTLCGHEYVCNEDLDKAVTSFRQAIFHDERHYNAWYGLGTIYFRQERLELAEYHFRRAISINPTSSVLQCYLGMVLNAHNRLEKNMEAIEILKNARVADPKNPQLHFQYAHVLLTNGSRSLLKEAFAALQTVKEYVPKEPAVYAMMGQVLHKLGRNQEALKHFNTAIDLDPKQAAALKSTIDLIQDPFLVEGGIDEILYEDETSGHEEYC